jgi:calcineurin-like phosphoesterase family protein
MIFYTSDTHFSHERIIELSDRPFEDAQEMNEMIIRYWNETVEPGDTVYHLGDVAMGTIVDSLPLVGRLNGFKILVPGNHDRVFSGASQKQQERFWPEYLKVFDMITEEQISIWGTDHLGVAKYRGAQICHFPYEGDSHEVDRYADKRPVDDGLPLLHGHVHEKWHTNGRQFNVGVDVNSFRPVSWDIIKDWMSSL